MIEKIVSGGQTGVDQAALNVSLELGIAIGGWCPKGGLDENGIYLLEKYPNLKETKTNNPDERTRLNVQDSDGTLIIVPSWPLPEKIKDGTRLTIKEFEEQSKPYLIIKLADQRFSVDDVKAWIKQNNIKILNIGGPRESNCPGIYRASCDFFRALFPQI
ncbi:putative molybdenum carrier protein [Legionella sp. D16C41]|uniref:putative molybdenum carrier protein n=1 Tax=Legionella sp. D16C41 TaxID=3402688 RepID=UPI003AF8C0A2